ncbi:hypothetical protein K4K49_003774 [Colletotrichum sp. SAR 10_70]|nr:hypothetical protein K4K50_000234 [Colletotrichum sp. SAR 10_71]KAI8190703.1 hypothetical protein K4K51_001073 [Colletotrichum sp. SAR 10_75]KAI8198372.1 hypothetical protein KHU50_008798 [Colletotrichum sp. SAR 10_65]KAI8204339.1 hypothetical protein K4K49_003774 [Colletotrichum sp. SAR 10_70]KAI8263774.1 hypothetical protein K4K53_006168 [Colletotrichum sp. SAR 10_77]
MGSQFSSHNQYRPTQQTPDPSLAPIRASNDTGMKLQVDKSGVLEDEMARYFDSELPWSHVEATSWAGRGDPSKDSGKKDRD